MNKLKKEKRKLIVLIFCFVIIFLLFWISPMFTSCIECDWLTCRDCSNYRIAEKVVLVTFIISSIIIGILTLTSIIKIISLKKGDDSI